MNEVAGARMCRFLFNQTEMYSKIYNNVTLLTKFFVWKYSYLS